MRAGKLDRTICIDRAATVVDDYGTPSQGWEEIAETRAELIQSSTQEFLKAAGTTGETAVVFRIRWRCDLRVSDRVRITKPSYFPVPDQLYEIVEIKELSRRDGIELRCTKSAS
ncbi:hypothetical protein A6U87_14715 [Rhizobium sp. AC44/96]|nr:hypothetical protein A6U87_14715 [Rhizobium sp. AC44/96]